MRRIPRPPEVAAAGAGTGVSVGEALGFGLAGIGSLACRGVGPFAPARPLMAGALRRAGVGGKPRYV